jgi:sugar lactone lactonase YvrE
LGRSIDQVTLSNGMCWGKSDGKGEGDPFDIFYFIDSALQTVDRFDYDEATGDIDLASRRTVVKVPSLADGGGVPDGMTIDHGGMLWVALGEAGGVVQYDPKTGDEIMVCQSPLSRIAPLSTIPSWPRTQKSIINRRLQISPACAILVHLAVTGSCGKKRSEMGAV